MYAMPRGHRYSEQSHYLHAPSNSIFPDAVRHCSKLQNRTCFASALKMQLARLRDTTPTSKRVHKDFISACVLCNPHISVCIYPK